MNITTAEIKRLMMECAKDGRNLNTDDFKTYIMRNSDKQFSPGQIAGALRQLSETGKLKKVERGLYRIAEVAADESDVNHGRLSFRQQLSECIEETENRLWRIVNNKNAWEMTPQEFEMITKIKELTNEMRRVIETR